MDPAGDQENGTAQERRRPGSLHLGSKEAGPEDRRCLLDRRGWPQVQGTTQRRRKRCEEL